MRPFPDNWIVGWLLVAAIICWNFSPLAAASSSSENPSASGAGFQTLHLEVLLNNNPSGLLAEFRRTSDGRIMCRRAELKELGINWPVAGPGSEFVDITTGNTLGARYDEGAQKMYLELGDGLRDRRVLDATGTSANKPKPQLDYGAALNYNLFASASSNTGRTPLSFTRPSFDGINASLDAHVFSPFGSLIATGIVGTTTFSDGQALRLDTTWSYSDPEDAVTYRAGDAISGGLAWTRPVRIGGFQAQRNFGVRPDLVTLALPQFSGSAAVPSVVDVYVNGLKSYSQDVGAGPFQINNLPVVTGSGEARVVVRDASGREVETKGSFYVTPQVLREGLTDFSLEAGMPRLAYGQHSFDYLEKPVASASVRHGLNDFITIEGHAEGGAGLLQLGAGLVSRVADLGVVSLAGAVSSSKGETGFLGYASFETQAFGMTFRGSAQHTFGDYNDLASITALTASQSLAASQFFGGGAATALRLNGKTPKALDTLSVGIPLTFDKSSLSLSFVHLQTAEDLYSNLINASYSRPFYFGGTASLTLFADLEDRKNSGIYASISFPLGVDSTLTAGVTSANRKASASVDVLKPLGADPGSVGWRVRDSEGDQVQRQASAAYRSQYARMEAAVRQDDQSSQVTAEIEGSLSTMGGRVYASNRIDDSFAVVSTGVPDVAVSIENRFVGKTESDGTLLVRGLRSFQSNKVEIDPTSLPVTADVPETKKFVVPGDRSGVLVDLAVRADAPAAIIILKRRNGSDIPAGSNAILVAGGEPGLVGYDGRVFLKGLSSQNAIHVSADGGDCNATFTFKPQAGRQVVIGPVVCQ